MAFGAVMKPKRRIPHGKVTLADDRPPETPAPRTDASLLEESGSDLYSRLTLLDCRRPHVCEPVHRGEVTHQWRAGVTTDALVRMVAFVERPAPRSSRCSFAPPPSRKTAYLEPDVSRYADSAGIAAASSAVGFPGGGRASGRVGHVGGGRRPSSAAAAADDGPGADAAAAPASSSSAGSGASRPGSRAARNGAARTRGRPFRPSRPAGRPAVLPAGRDSPERRRRRERRRGRSVRTAVHRRDPRIARPKCSPRTRVSVAALARLDRHERTEETSRNDPSLRPSQARGRGVRRGTGVTGVPSSRTLPCSRQSRAESRRVQGPRRPNRSLTRHVQHPGESGTTHGCRRPLRRRQPSQQG